LIVSVHDNIREDREAPKIAKQNVP